MRLSLIAVLLSGCATTTTAGSADLKREALSFDRATPELPGWKRLRTDEFELVTDLPNVEAERAGQLLTQSFDGLKAMFGKAPMLAPRPLRIIAMADDLDFERRYGKGVGGFAAMMTGETVIVVYGPPNKWFTRPSARLESKDSVVQHELAHAVLFRFIPKQPGWFAEGMAQYLETFRWVDAETVLLGEPNISAWRSYAAIRSVTMASLLEDRASAGLQRHGEYGLSWAFVHYAINREPQRFTQLMAALIDGDEQAFRHTFGDDTARLDLAIHQHLKAGEYAKVQLHVPLRAPQAARLEPTPAPTALLDGFMRKPNE